MRVLTALLITTLLLPAVAAAASDYRFPFADPYKATVYGTPPEDRYHFKDPAMPEVRSIRIDGRRVPDVFSYSRDMNYTVLLRDDPAPLIFVVAGTGGEHNSIKMEFLTQVFHEAGYHVVALSSPTHMNFVISASEHGVPGYVPYDVADLYRVMQWIKAEIEQEAEVTGYAVTGYSLGAMHAAFLAHRDATRGDFDFRKVLMINPPVSLYHSVTRLDSWLTGANLGDRTVHEQIQRFIDKFSAYYETAEVTDLDDNFLYRMVTEVDFRDEDLKALIAVDFRTTSSSMIFASDVCLRAEYLVPPDHYPLTTGTSLLPYAKQAFDISFENYLDEYLLPFLQYMQPGMDRYTMLKQCSLYEIRSYLMDSEHIQVIGNRDDVILNEHDLDFIESVFGERAQLFPTGGHCGNMMYTPFVEALLRKVQP